MTVTHVCGNSEGCMCFYDPDCNDELVSARLVPTDEAAVERAARALAEWSGFDWAQGTNEGRNEARHAAAAILRAAGELDPSIRRLPDNSESGAKRS